ncbi:MAG: ABC transporter permease [Weeksellaceae bacterium]
MIDTWNEIYHALSKNKSRTFITMIGVAWGMFLFVWLLGMVNGMRNGFDRDLKGSSTNSLFIWAEKTSVPYKGYGRGRTFDLVLDDVEGLKKRFPEIRRIAPRNVTFSRVRYNTSSGEYQVFGDFPDQNKMFKKTIPYGRFINDSDIESRSKVCVIGEDIVEELFPVGISEVVGKSVVINNVSFKIVGVYENKGGFEGGKVLFMPFSTFSKLYNQPNRLGWLAVNIKDSYDIKEAEENIKSYLKEQHDIAPNDTQAIGGFNLGEMFGKLFSFMSGLEFLTTIVGFLTLFAGSIAVSSILLITVKERTQEFGIRRALGAQPRQIITQIMLEAVTVTILSGLMGVIFGTALLAIINVMVDNSEDANVPLVNSSVDVGVMFGAFAIIVLMSLFAGLLPAWRAIQIKPIDALRDE